jgi:hypothetical protein
MDTYLYSFLFFFCTEPEFEEVGDVVKEPVVAKTPKPAAQFEAPRRPSEVKEALEDDEEVMVEVLSMSES